MADALYKVEVIDADHPAYGLTGDVHYINYYDGKVSFYHVNFKGYDNCIKCGYSDEFIKRVKLDEIGFYFFIRPESVKIIEDYCKS